MLNRFRSSPRTILIVFVIVVNVLASLITSLFWIFFSDSIPAADIKPFGGLIPLGIVIIIAAVISTPLSKKAAKPTLDMIQATHAIADGDYSVRVDEEGKGQVHELLHSFNLMTAELNSTEMMRTDFINTFSHEFKTPIVSIRGFARLLRKGNLSEVKKNEYLDYIVSESERLSELSSNILLLSKYENQQFISDRTEYDLAEQLRQCILLLEKQWESKNITFDLDIEPEELPFCSNEEMLNHVWLNLIGNAVKFSHESGRIQVTARKTDDHIEVKVADEGIGMNEEAVSHIYEKFYQADKARSSAGNGLGLSLVHRIIQLCNGSISVKSTEGIGSCFTVILPNTESRKKTADLH